MFAKLTAVVVALAVFASAAPTDSYQCNTGAAQCCNSVQSSDTVTDTSALAIITAVLQGVVAQVGVDCTPITVIGAGSGANCAQQPVCCENNNFNGVVNIGCTPINAAL